MAVAQQSYSLIYMQNGWDTTMQESFCGAFLEKRQRVPSRPPINHNLKIFFQGETVNKKDFATGFLVGLCVFGVVAVILLTVFLL